MHEYAELPMNICDTMKMFTGMLKLHTQMIHRHVGCSIPTHLCTYMMKPVPRAEAFTHT